MRASIVLALILLTLLTLRPGPQPAAAVVRATNTPLAATETPTATPITVAPEPTLAPYPAPKALAPWPTPCGTIGDNDAPWWRISPGDDPHHLPCEVTPAPPPVDYPVRLVLPLVSR